MKAKKQLFAFLLIIVFVLTSLPLSLAASHIDTTDEIFIDSSPRFIDVSAICSLLPSSQNDISASTVTYSYSFNQTSNDTAQVSLNALWAIGTAKVPVQVAGTINAYTLSSGSILWEGALRGNATISGAYIPALLGFSKLNDSSDIQANLTIQPTDLNAIFISFGQQSYSEDILQEIFTPPPSSPQISTAAITNSSDYILKKMGYFLFPSGDYSGYAQTSKIYYNPTLKTCVISLQSHCDNVISSLGVGSGASVNKVYWELTRNGVPYIAGFNYIPYSSSPSTVQRALRPLFEDLLSLLGVPTSTISSILDSLTGTVTSYWSTANPYASISFGLLESANFDNISSGMPIEFQINPNGAPSGTFTATTSIEYRVYAPNHTAYPGSIFYVSSGERDITFDITF